MRRATKKRMGGGGPSRVAQLGKIETGSKLGAPYPYQSLWGTKGCHCQGRTNRPRQSGVRVDAPASQLVRRGRRLRPYVTGACMPPFRLDYAGPKSAVPRGSGLQESAPHPFTPTLGHHIRATSCLTIWQESSPRGTRASPTRDNPRKETMA